MGQQVFATVAEMEGKKLKSVLAKHGYKPAHLAKALGVSETATSKYVAARRGSFVDSGSLTLDTVGRPQFGHAFAALDTCLPQSGHVVSAIGSPLLIDCHRRAKNKLNFLLDHWFSRG